MSKREREMGFLRFVFLIILKNICIYLYIIYYICFLFFLLVYVFNNILIELNFDNIYIRESSFRIF